MFAVCSKIKFAYNFSFDDDNTKFEAAFQTGTVLGTV